MFAVRTVAFVFCDDATLVRVPRVHAHDAYAPAARPKHVAAIAAGDGGDELEPVA